MKKSNLILALFVLFTSAFFMYSSFRSYDVIFRQNIEALSDGEGISLSDKIWKVTVQYAIDPITLTPYPISFTCETGGEYPCQLNIG